MECVTLSIDELLEVVIKYKLAFIAAKRAKIQRTSLEEHKCVKPVGIAL